VIGIVVSRADSASVNIGEHLLDLADWDEVHDESLPDSRGGETVYRLADAELRVFDDLHLHLDNADTVFCDCDSTDTLDLLVFASRHAGETGPLLSAHVTGNFGPAEYGGHDHSLATAAPNAQAKALEALAEHAPEEYAVGMEGTHHGPTEIETPSLFVELGSDEPQWNDTDGARAVAQAILALRRVDYDIERTLVGFGGGHYVPRFERVVRETDWTVGHVGVDWALDAMGNPTEHRSLLQRAFEQSGAEYALIDGDYPELERVIADLGYRSVSETWARETTGVPLELVKRMEREIGSVEDGLRFGERAKQMITEGGVIDENRDRESDENGFTIIDLPSELLSEANGIDHERTLTAIQTHTVAHTTEEGGTQLADTVVLPQSTDRNGLISAFCTILGTKYDTVERDDNQDRIVAHETAFSPALARTQGVPEGPAFGRLANGQRVEIDGTVVSPSDVRERRTHMFSYACLSDARQTCCER
jgi:D-aminoacyl-tRNA deacylase